jgi:hypothetical protein
MGQKSARWLAGGLWFLGFVLNVVGSIWYAVGVKDGFSPFAVVITLVYLAFLTVGVLILANLPRHPIGWIFCAIGINFGLNNLLNSYAQRAIDSPNGLPGGAIAAWFGWLWIINLYLLGTYLLQFFPTGRLPSPRWRPLAWLTGIGIFLTWFAEYFAPGQLPDFERENPFGIAAAKELLAVVDVIGLALTAVCALLSVVSVVVRFRHARQIERQQIKWFVFSVSLLLPYMIFASQFESGVTDYGFAVVISLTPASVGLAILRYRLFEIDRLINRTLVYSLLTAILVGADLLLIVIIEHLFEPITSGSDLVVAGSTLAVAACIRPLRSRIQRIVDRRFYRHKYDAARTLEAFSNRLRDEIDLDALLAELAAVVQETMQPAQVSVWLGHEEANR